MFGGWTGSSNCAPVDCLITYQSFKLTNGFTVRGSPEEFLPLTGYCVLWPRVKLSFISPL